MVTPGQPFPGLENPFSAEFFLNIQPKPPLVQFEAVSSCGTTILFMLGLKERFSVFKAPCS